MNTKPLHMMLVDPAGFDQAFFDHLPKFKSASEYFYYLNGVYEEAFGKPRYSDYASYSVSKAKRLRKVR